MSDIDLTEATEAAARALFGRGGYSEEDFDEIHVLLRRTVDEDALAVITAALPYIREQVAREIEALADTCHGARGDARPCGSLWRRGVQDAARIARGEQP